MATFGPLGKAILSLVAAALLTWSHELPAEEDIVVYRGSNCGCCDRWIGHFRDAKFRSTAKYVEDSRLIGAPLGVPKQLGSHTDIAGGYWVEGHVPVNVLCRLLHENPDDIRGIAVHGMAIGSPGMEGPKPRPYRVVSIPTKGAAYLYATITGQSTS